MDTKICSNCGERLPITDFRVDNKGYMSGKCRVCQNMYHKDNSLRNKYNISLDDYAEMFEEQGGVCAICQQRSNKLLAVDHDHETGQIRGLLCSNCNTALGMVKENIGTLFMMIDYLKIWHNERNDFYRSKYLEK